MANNHTKTTTQIHTIDTHLCREDALYISKHNWTPPESAYAASSLAMAIMGYRRQYGSDGIAFFAEKWLEPTISNIIADLKARGFTVSEQVVSDSTPAFGTRNYLITVMKDGASSDTLYVAHYDTVDRDVVQGYYTRRNSVQPEQQPQAKFKIVSIENGIAYLDMTNVINTGAACLGADDGAGLGVMLHLLHSGVLGGYCFTTAEECGGFGARAVVDYAGDFLEKYKRSIEIDRRGVTDVVYVQGVGGCASEKFAQWVCDKLAMGHTPSEFGTYTDNAEFAGIIAENINIAAGYIDAHTSDEKVSLIYLDNLAEKLVALDWKDAPNVRQAGDFGYNVYNSDMYFDNANNQSINYSTVYELIKLCEADFEFARFVLSSEINTLADLDECCYTFYGYTFSELL